MWLLLISKVVHVTLLETTLEKEILDWRSTFLIIWMEAQANLLCHRSRLDEEIDVEKAEQEVYVEGEREWNEWGFSVVEDSWEKDGLEFDLEKGISKKYNPLSNWSFRRSEPVCRSFAWEVKEWNSKKYICYQVQNVKHLFKFLAICGTWSMFLKTKDLSGHNLEERIWPTLWNGESYWEKLRWSS